MKLFCTKEIVDSIKKLEKNNSYKDLRRELYLFFINAKKSNSYYSGTRLNGSSPNPFIKKRLEGSGGYRLYFYIILTKKTLILSSIHPKTGKEGRENLSSFEIKKSQENCLRGLEGNDLFTINLNDTEESVEFIP